MYNGTSANSTLRPLCSLGFTVSLGKLGHRTDCDTWKRVFNDFADLGWDYFRRMQKGQTSARDVTSKGACHFHDHSDVFGWVRHEDHTCPLPEGAPVRTLEEKNVPLTGSESDSTAEMLRKFDREHKYAADKDRLTTEFDPRESRVDWRVAISNPEHPRAIDEVLPGPDDDSGFERRSQWNSKKDKNLRAGERVGSD